ncbi:uncharacterized protein BO97DRAFT_421639 [Aspergillus homomorphus CBS 101889]|uniref:DUF1749-domain-containing protein n=1 Tax=Aspergillus homomorphus (strain CBS 101889) TaxID=1450537 RepID=A0A395I8E4_ASPHC|nr:DUF1749-domain-containing protein [Aspergillus homomorphus CBS 101889]RAL15523.1 DUF1749-domain-containing protein [Aspergillus homomorphus CBS 101889]
MSPTPHPSPPGILHEYAPHLVAFEFTTTATNEPKPNTLIFIGGLTDGLHTVPYVRTLAHALSTTKSKWSVFNLLLSSSYSGFGTHGLDTDVAEMAKCIDFIRTRLPHKAAGKVVIMGHSTGSQDVLHYLYSSSKGDGSGEGGLGNGHRPAVDGAIMQAPVSDREALLVKIQEVGEESQGGEGKEEGRGNASKATEVRGAYDQLVHMARSGPRNFLLPMDLLAAVGLPENTPITAERFLSLASPDSPQRPSADDLFSSDLDDECLRGTFGRVAEQGRLKAGARLMVLFSGADEYLAPWVDVQRLMGRWKAAVNAGGKEIWDEEGSAAIEGASHNVSDIGQDELLRRVSGFLERVEKQT